jgi:hypothetical protein
MKKITKIVSVTLLLVILASQSIFASNLLPTGGSEWDWNPSAWTDEDGVHHSNCYFYAVMKRSSTTSDISTMQPGYDSDDPLDTYEELNESSIVSKVQDDLDMQLLRDFYPTSADTVPPAGYRKVALVIAPEKDYHWYEQNSDGYWSHKRGNANAPENVDDSGNLISDPRYCDRSYSRYVTNMFGTYEVTTNYSEFCGFYMVK